MNNTKIEWCNSTWNPVTGCLHGCEYCYARTIAKRFGTRKNAYWEKPTGDIHHCSGVDMPILDSPIMFTAESTEGGDSGFPIAVNPYPAGFTPTFHQYLLDKPKTWKKSQNIFPVSMGDLFGEWVPDYWIKQVFDACEAAPQHNYLFLTKNPARYLELYENKAFPYKENYWFGTTITSPDQEFTWVQDTPYKCFVSIEPIHARFGGIVHGKWPDWVIIGAETGKRPGKIIPKREWVTEIVNQCHAAGVPVFLKNSLADIWDGDLVQEYPLGLLKKIDSNNKNSG